MSGVGWFPDHRQLANGYMRVLQAARVLGATQMQINRLLFFVILILIPIPLSFCFSMGSDDNDMNRW